jgi:hypothetical protein
MDKNHADYEWRMEEYLSSRSWTCDKCHKVVPALMAAIHLLECSMEPLFNPMPIRKKSTQEDITRVLSTLDARGEVREDCND